uniref:T6SS Phospholipase effector Tle1-like catalytic domain-containing protein n=1 Tax=Psilocybe cubensis TaxID=181762 RepID=A0A8H7YAL2_PSICU
MSSEADSNLTPKSSLVFQPDSEATSRTSPSRSPRRNHTVPLVEEDKMNTYRRIIVFCDGTWQDGISTQCSKYTNVLRLARSVNRQDERMQPVISQIVFYQSGVGSEHNFYSQYVEGATGDKVEEAYAFIAHNYNPGDEIFLFGFSRGAYTARMVAMFIGEIGVLDSKDMDNFASIFLNFQALGKTQDQQVLASLPNGVCIAKSELEAKLGPWRDPNSNGRRRVDIDGDKFTVKCLGVWDTVGSTGLPEEIAMSKGASHVRMFGFPNHKLGVHIQYAYQALALNEMRKDFIGGGYDHHDLSDISLMWMASQVEDLMSMDMNYLRALINPVAPWGKQKPHDSATGIFILADKIQRELPLTPNNVHTHETFHSSILEQETLDPTLAEKLANVPEFIEPLTSLEEAIKQYWPYDHNTPEAQAYATSVNMSPPVPTLTRSPSWFTTLFRSISSSSLRITGTNAKASGQRTSVVQTKQSETITIQIDPGSPSLRKQIGHGLKP